MYKKRAKNALGALQAQRLRGCLAAYRFIHRIYESFKLSSLFLFVIFQEN